MFKPLAYVAALFLALAGAVSPAAAQIVPSTTYTFNLQATCDSTRSRCTLAEPVVNPDGSFIGLGTASTPSVIRSTGAPNMATGQVAVTTSSTLVAAARAGRSRITITSTSAVVFYVGNTGVTTATGAYVAGAAGASITLNTAAAVYAVGASAVTVSYAEEY